MRVIRPTIRLLCVVILLLLVVLFVRSLWWFDDINIDPPRTRRVWWDITLYRGRIALYRVGAFTYIPPRHPRPWYEWESSVVDGEDVEAPGTPFIGTGYYGRSNEIAGNTIVLYAVVIPLPLLAGPFAIPLIGWFWSHRRRSRLGDSKCLTCGYDLRAHTDTNSGDKCPECGTPISNKEMLVTKGNPPCDP